MGPPTTRLRSASWAAAQRACLLPSRAQWQAHRTCAHHGAAALMGNETAKLAAPDDAERFSSALSGIGEVNTDPARCAPGIGLLVPLVPCT